MVPAASDHVDAAATAGVEREESLSDSAEHWADADECNESDAEDETAAALEWTDRSRWIRHVILWKQEHDAHKRTQRGRADKTVRMRGKQPHHDGSDGAVAARSEHSHSGDDGDHGREESADSISHNNNTNEGVETAEELTTAVRAQPTDTRTADDTRQRQQQQQGPATVETLSSDDMVRPTDSDSLTASATAGGPRSHRLRRDLPSMILKHISALKQDSAEAGDSLSLGTLAADTQRGQHGPTSLAGLNSSEHSAASASEHSVASLAPPVRHMQQSSRMDGVDEQDRSSRHRAQRSVTAVRSASGKWQLGDLSAGTPTFAQIASLGRSLLHTSMHDNASADDAFDVDMHNHSTTRGGTHTAATGHAASRTGSASTAPASSDVVGSARSSLSPGQLKADLLASGLVRDRTHVFTVYPASVSATELIDWLVANKHADDRQHACLVSKTLMLVGLRSFHQPQSDAADFADDGRFYSFESNGTRMALRMALDRPRDRSVSTKQALAALVQRAAASASAGKQSVSPADTLVGQVERARLHSSTLFKAQPASSHGDRETGTQLTTLQEVRVDGYQQSEGGAQQHRLTTADSSSGRNPAASRMVADTAVFESHSKGSSPPTATRPVFLRVRKGSSRGQIMHAGHAELTAAHSDRADYQPHAETRPSTAAADDASPEGAVHLSNVRSPTSSTRAARSPSAHRRSLTAAVATGHTARGHRLTAAGSGATAAVRPSHAGGSSATQDALFALGVADLALVEAQLAEQRQRDEDTASRPAAATLRPFGENAASRDNRGSLNSQPPMPLRNNRGHVRSPTLPASGVLSSLTADNSSHSKPATQTLLPAFSASSPASHSAQLPASRANSLRNVPVLAAMQAAK